MALYARISSVYRGVIMAKVYVTKELAETLKELRIQYKVQAKDLAKVLEKSPAYVSKLERGGIQTISKDELEKILNCITTNTDDFEKIAERISDLLNIKYSNEEIKKQIWFYNFDMVYRKIPIPIELIDEINEKIKVLNVNRTYLFDRINSNEALPEEDKYNDSIIYNEWYNSSIGLCIKLKLSLEDFNDFLDNKLISTSYIYPYSMLTYLFKIEFENENRDKKNPPFQYYENLATQVLNKHKFYSLIEKSALIKNQKIKEEKDSILTSFDKENSEIINTILNHFKFLTDSNIIVANERLKTFTENLNFDIGFMSKIISLEFSKLEKTSYERKKQFILDLQNLIDNYSSNNDKDNTIELY